MKRRTRTTLLAVAAAALVIPVAACSSGNSASGSTNPAGQKVVYVPGLTGNPFYTSVGCGAAAEAKKTGIDFSTQGAPTFSVPLQTQIVNSVVATKPAAIVISITDPTSMKAPLLQAKNAGIKVITIDGDLADKSIATTNIQSDNFKGGQLAGQKLAELIGGKGDVIALDNVAGSLIAAARLGGFLDTLKAYPDIHFGGSQYTQNSTANAATTASTAATTNPKLAGIYSLATNNTQGAITGLREVNKTSAVKLVGFDSSDPIVEALHAGTIGAVILQDPLTEGAMGIDSAVNAIEGKPVPRDQAATFAVATPANVDSPEVQSHIYKTHC
jgi:ribose transport system substrate-binding protein